MGVRGPEVRIGLVLYGGVSLAVYIYGVVVEVQRLLRAAEELGDGRSVDEMSAYARALYRSGASAVTVDILSGTSAGGINGILLAKALASGADVGAVRGLWIEHGDIGKLLQPRGARRPLSLLRSRRFECLLRDGFAQLGRPARRGAPRQPILDLFVSATRIRGGKRVLRDSLNTTIDTQRHRYVFRLKLRTRRDGQGYEKDDLADDRWLVQLARATSAFPVAFEPVMVRDRKDDLGGDDDAAGWFADGGILNNRPFTEAVEAIVSHASDRPVRRWLFSIDPDPVPAEEEVDDPDAPPSFERVALRSISAIPRYQSIVRDLVALERHNQSVAASEKVVFDIEADLARAGEEAAEAPLGPGVAAGYEALRRQAWERELADLIAREAPAEGKGGETGDRVDRAVLHARLRELAAQVFALPRTGDEAAPAPDWDLAWARRRVYYAIKLLGMAEEVEHPDPGALREALWGEYELLSSELWQLSARWREIAGAEAGGRGEEGAAALGAAVMDEAVDRLRGVGAGSGERLADAIGATRLQLRDPGPPAGEEGATVALGEVFERFARRDALLLSADVYGGLRQRDRIEHAQISPRAAINTGVDWEDKLAGDSVGHFGGFLDRAWRENDLMWGRLDAAETLMRALLAERDDLAPELVDAVQMEVLEDELPEDDLAELLTGPQHWKLALQERMRGGPAPSELDGKRAVGLLLRASRVTRRMLLAAAAASARGGALNRVRAAALRGLATALALLIPAAYLPARLLLARRIDRQLMAAKRPNR